MMKRAHEVAVAVALFSLASTAGSARADLIASESFVYAPGATVNGQSGGTGWSGAWITGQPAAFMSAAAIAGAPAIGQTGGSLHVTAVGRVFRIIDTSPTSPAAIAGLLQSHTAMFFGTTTGIGAPGTTVWVGVLVSGGTGVSGDETQYHLYDGARTDAASLALSDNNKDGEVVAMLRGAGVPQWGFERTCNHAACGGVVSSSGFFATSPSVPFGGTHWSVTRFVFRATTTEITMWRDPTPGAVAPLDTAALTLTPFGGGAAVQTVITPALFFNTIAPNASGNFNYSVDEIRITTTFAELSTGMAGGGTDAGVSIDAGSTTDAGTRPDAATAPDAAAVDGGTMAGDTGTSTDAASATDSGTRADSGSLVDAMRSADASSAVDAGTGPTSHASCGCGVPGRARGSAATLGALLPLALWLVRARVRTRRGGTGRARAR